MARMHGDDDLFRLIHALLPEEKRYFMRFAKRQVVHGNNYLKLFRAVNQQPVFDHAALKEKFKNYKVVKVYLKEMIMDSMVLYYRRSHPHIHLHNQFQKIHLLVVKGLHNEALKTVEKALKESRKMELFAITSALLNLQHKLSAHTFTNNEAIRKHISQYRHAAMKNLADERNLIESDLLSAEWHLRFKTTEINWEPVEIEKEKQAVLAFQATSLRAEIKQAGALHWVEHIRQNTAGIYEVSKRLMDLEQRLKNRVDSSYGTVFTLSNYIMLCLERKKYREAEKLCNKLITGGSKTKFFDDVAFIMGILYKMAVHYLTGRFEKGLDELQRHEQKLLEAIKRINDKPRLRVFYAQKIIFLFINKKYRECWICIRDTMNTLKQNPDYIPDVMMVQMMIQVEFGNFDLLPGMAKKAERKMVRLKRKNFVHQTLLDFFRQLSPDNMQGSASATFHTLRAYCEKTGMSLSHPIWWLRYDHWLLSKTSTQSIEELVRKEI